MNRAAAWAGLLRRAAAPLFVLAVALLVAAHAAETPPEAAAPPADSPADAAPPIPVTLSVDVAAVKRALGPELARVGLEVAAAALARPRGRLERWLCASVRAGSGLADACPAGGVILAGPHGAPQCTIHGAGDEPAAPRRDRGDTAVALAAVDAVVARGYLDGASLRPLRDRADADLTLAAGAHALTRLGLSASDTVEANLDSAEGERTRLRVTRTAAHVALRWSPVTLATTGAVPLDASLPSDPTTAPPLARLDVPIGTPMWRIFESRMPGNVGLGRPPRDLTVQFRTSEIEVRVRHDRPESVVTLDRNLGAGLSLLKVATAFKRKGSVDHVFEYLFRAERRLDGNDLVLTGKWPPELRGGLAAAIEAALEPAPASPALVAAACRLRRLPLERAVATWESERGAALTGHPERLIEEGLLDRLPQCPEGGALSVEDGTVRCAVHPNHESP